MSILLNNNGYGNYAWQKEISALLPDMPIYVYPCIPDRKVVRYALVWDHPDGDLKSYPNLQAILSLGAGVEHLTRDPELPDLPIVRLSDPSVARDMGLHSLYWVLNFHRNYHLYAAQQKNRQWQRHEACAPDEFQVGVLGLGQIGTEVAQTISRNGYAVSGWDHGKKHLPGVTSHHGEAGLPTFMERLNVIINCLPLTPTTKGMIDASFLKRLPDNAFLINISRGGVICHEGLISALETGLLAGAALDAFDQEPLPSDSALWHHRGIHVTPHMSGATYAKTAAKVVAANIRRLEDGQDPFPLYDPDRGY